MRGHACAVCIGLALLSFAGCHTLRGPVAPSTDVWPLGLLAFRLLTGYLFWKAPYDPGASVMMLMAEAFMHPMPTASARALHYKCPERIIPVDSLPRSPAGKILRDQLP